MIQIAPSILAADFAVLAEQVRRVEQAGARILHIDVMDGHFVPNITFGPVLVKSLRPHSRMRFDVHLMIENPELYIEEFARAGADHITIHWEATRHIHRAVLQIKSAGCRAGVAFNPATPLNGIEYIVRELDMILLMTVNPGFGGQKFIDAVVPKISQLRGVLDAMGRKDCPIEVDGGIQISTVTQAVRAGAAILVAGAAVFGHNNPEQSYRELLAAAVGTEA